MLVDDVPVAPSLEVISIDGIVFWLRRKISETHGLSAVGGNSRDAPGRSRTPEPLGPAGARRLLACPPAPSPATARQCESPQPLAQPGGTLGTCLQRPVHRDARRSSAHLDANVWRGIHTAGCGNCKGKNSGPDVRVTAPRLPPPPSRVWPSSLSHRCTTLAFSPLRSAIAATDAPLWRQA